MAVNICLGCHSDIDELRKKVGASSARVCAGVRHVPHCLTAATTNIWCAPRATRSAWSATVRIGPQKDEANHLLTLFNGTVRLPDDYYVKNKVAILPLRYGLGHPVIGHPVSDVMDPTNQSKVKMPLSCYSCHQPHASAQPDLLVKDQVNNMAFCDNCHKNRLNMNETVTPGK